MKFTDILGNELKEGDAVVMTNVVPVGQIVKVSGGLALPNGQQMAPTLVIQIIAPVNADATGRVPLIKASMPETTPALAVPEEKVVIQ